MHPRSIWKRNVIRSGLEKQICTAVKQINSNFEVLGKLTTSFFVCVQALNVYVPSYESNGRMWPHMHTRILAALFLSQITMFGYFSIKKFIYSPLLLPLPFVSLAFGYVCKKRFYSSFRITPMEVACNNVKKAPSLSSIVKAYTHPCLLMEDKFDDVEQNEDARPPISGRTTSIATSNAWPTTPDSISPIHYMDKTRNEG